MICSYGNILAALVLLLATAYWYLKKTFNYWKNQNVPVAPDPVLGFGHMLPIITLKENIVSFTERLYKLTDASVLGFYFLRTPSLIVRDPEIAKCVLQTNFSSFRANLIKLDEENDPILTKNPFFANDPHTWKGLRMRTGSHLSGKKLRVLHQFMNKVLLKMRDFVDSNIKKNEGFYECQLKIFFERYTGEFVANAAFGIEGESFVDNPSPKAFTRIAKMLLEPSFINGIKQAVLFYLPFLGKILRMSFIDQSTENYFRKTLKRVVDERNQKNITVEDYLQFCRETSSDDEFNTLIADIILFYLDSYETSSLTLSILFYHLSKNTDVQEKLRQHIQSVVAKNGGEITYESLKDMTYLDQVMFESMRITPAAGILQKMCTEEITLKGSDGTTCHLKPGHIVIIPTAALQVDNRFWPDPEVFNPERFSPENLNNHHKFAFLPFSEGPRMCVGMRLAQMLVKLATASLILKYSVEKSTITIEPLERVPNTFMPYFKGGLWAKFKKIS